MKSLNALFGKSKDPAAEKQLARIMTANELINVKDIENGILYTRDNHIYAFIRIKPISLELLSPAEQKIKKDKLTAELAGINELQKILVIPRPVDISPMLDWLQHRYRETGSQHIREIIKSEIQDANDVALSGETLEQNHFLILSRPAKRDAEKDLLKAASNMVGIYNICGIEAHLCKNDEIIKMLHLFFNPTYSYLEDEDINEYIPFTK